MLSSLSKSFDKLHVDVIDKELRGAVNRIQREYIHQDRLQTCLEAIHQDKADAVRVQTLEQKVDQLASQLTSVSIQLQGE